MIIGELRIDHLFTPERLFGEVATSGLSRHTVFLERAKTETGRDELLVRLALAAYLVARLVDAYLFSDRSNIAGQEGFLWQLGAVRRHLQELPGDATETGHLIGVVEAIPLNGEPPATLRVGLSAYAYFLEHEGRLTEALEVLALAVRTHGSPVPPADFAACARFAARLNRLLARWEQALQCFEAAEEAALSIGDQVVAYRARLGRGAVYRGQGNLPLARRIAEDVLAEATELKMDEVRALAYSDLSAVFGALGLALESLQAKYQWFILTPDVADRMRALGDLGIGLRCIGAYPAARLALTMVANSKAEFRVRVNAIIELIDLESCVGDRVAFERYRLQAESHRDRMPPSMTADYLYKIGNGFARFGQVTRGLDALKAGLEIAERQRLNAWYFRIEQAIRELAAAEPSTTQKSAVPLPAISQAPAVQEMETGLREYAALQLA